MTNAFTIIMQKFGQGVGMGDFFAQKISFELEAVLVFAFLCCFFGLKTVRLWSAVLAFFLTAIAISEMLHSITHMGVIVITFTMIGLIIAFIVYHWYKLSLFLLSAIVGYSIAAVFTANIWICLGAAIVLGALSAFISPLVVILTTAVWGGITLGFEGLIYLNVLFPEMGIILTDYKIAAATGLTVIGLFLQYSMNKSYVTPAKRRGFERSTVIRTYSTER